jgi:hypothetical protein
LLITAIVVPRSLNLVTLMMEVIRSSEISVLKESQRNIPENDIPHSHRRANLKSYNINFVSKTSCKEAYQLQCLLIGMHNDNDIQNVYRN